VIWSVSIDVIPLTRPVEQEGKYHQCYPEAIRSLSEDEGRLLTFYAFLRSCIATFEVPIPLKVCLAMFEGADRRRSAPTAEGKSGTARSIEADTGTAASRPHSDRRTGKAENGSRSIGELKARIDQRVRLELVLKLEYTAYHARLVSLGEVRSLSEQHWMVLCHRETTRETIDHILII
jgi:hypothetical protein